LIYLGLKTFLSKPLEKGGSVSHVTLLKDFLTTLLLTLTNPMTIFSYLAIFAGLGITRSEASVIDQGGWLILGVFLGSGIWWLMLSEGVTMFRKKVSQKVMKWVNRIAGLVIIGFGLAAFIYASFS
jgi:threonine/homoserine/homoserine lactone efflux protein